MFLRQYDVEAARIENELHGAVVHQQMIEGHIRILGCDLYYHLTPELRILQHIGLVDGSYFLAPGASQVEGHTCDAFDFRARYKSWY